MARPRRYWLMKSEPGCFSFEDLKNAPGRTTCWDGVRNYKARNLLRDEVKSGDGVLFYHSNIAEPAVVGLAKVVREGYVDHTALDPRSAQFDPRATEDNLIWYMVDVQFSGDLSRPLTREHLRNHPVLAEMEVLKKGNRLSVQPVTAQQWRAILELSATKDPFQ